MSSEAIEQQKIAWPRHWHHPVHASSGGATVLWQPLRWSLAYAWLCPGAPGEWIGRRGIVSTMSISLWLKLEWNWFNENALTYNILHSTMIILTGFITYYTLLPFVWMCMWIGKSFGDVPGPLAIFQRPRYEFVKTAPILQILWYLSILKFLSIPGTKKTNTAYPLAI